MEVSGQLHAPANFPPEKETPDTHCIGGWVGSRAGLNAVARRKKKSHHCTCRESNPARPAHSLVTKLAELEVKVLCRYKYVLLPRHSLFSNMNGISAVCSYLYRNKSCPSLEFNFWYYHSLQKTLPQEITKEFNNTSRSIKFTSEKRAII
jgi:hypothetical protein